MSSNHVIEGSWTKTCHHQSQGAGTETGAAQKIDIGARPPMYSRHSPVAHLRSTFTRYSFQTGRHHHCLRAVGAWWETRAIRSDRIC
jgi:hypothetical protein